MNGIANRNIESGWKPLPAPPVLVRLPGGKSGISPGRQERLPYPATSRRSRSMESMSPAVAADRVDSIGAVGSADPTVVTDSAGSENRGGRADSRSSFEVHAASLLPSAYPRSGVLTFSAPPQPSCAVKERSKSIQVAAAETGAAWKRMVTFVSASGGVGLSVTCAFAALELQRRGRRCALVDADFEAGGLDVLLGMENDRGLRFSTLKAPLGRIDGNALCRQLPKWQGIPILAYDRCNGAKSQWWEVAAAVEALAAEVDVVLIDASRGRAFEDVPQLIASSKVVVAELSVLGLARAKALLSSRIGGGPAAPWFENARKDQEAYERDARNDGATDLHFDTEPDRKGALAVVGVMPRGIYRGRGAVGVDEASDYLGREVLGPVSMDPKAVSDALEGLGLRIGSKTSKKAFARLASLIDDGQ